MQREIGDLASIETRIRELAGEIGAREPGLAFELRCLAERQFRAANRLAQHPDARPRGPRELARMEESCS